MRAALLMALLAACAAQARDRKCRIDRTGARIGDCVSYAFFEAFPASGAGTSGACSTTAPTGAKGETLTFTRTGNATCSKQGLATTGIANGDLVVLSGNQPRVELDSQGVLGLRLESARTNLTLQSNDLTNAYWQKGGNLASPTVTTAAAVAAPDGTLGVTQIAMTRPTTSDYQYVQDDHTLGADGTYVGSLYVKAAPGYGGKVVSLQGYTGTLNVGAVDVTLSEATWTRAVTTPQAQTAGSSKRIVAVGLGTAGASIGDVVFYAWLGQAELGSYATSPIPTTSAAVTRNAEAATVNGNTLGLPTARYSLAASIQTLAPGAAFRGIVEGQVGANSGVGFFTSSGFLRTQNLTAGADNITNFAWTPNVNQLYRLVTLNDGTNQSMLIDGTTVIGPVATTPPDSPWSTTTGIGYAPAGPAQLDGIISRVCIDPSASRCR